VVCDLCCKRNFYHKNPNHKPQIPNPQLRELEKKKTNATINHSSNNPEFLTSTINTRTFRAKKQKSQGLGIRD
jgi:hypothetical protein